jgi:hypothetical protein
VEAAAESAATPAPTAKTGKAGAQQTPTAQPPANPVQSVAPPVMAVAGQVVAPPAAMNAAAPVAGPPAAPSAEPIQFVSAPSGKLFKELDQLHQEMTQKTTTLHLVAGTASFVTLGMSIVYVLWTIRAGYLVASLLSSMPAWRIIDPLPILDHFEDDLQRRRRKAGEDSESLETLVDQLRPAREIVVSSESERG